MPIKIENTEIENTEIQEEETREDSGPEVPGDYRPVIASANPELPDYTADVEGFTEAERAQMNARAALIAAGEIEPPNLEWVAEKARELDIPERVAMILPERVARESLARKVASLPRLAAWGARNGEQAAIVAANGAWAREFAKGFEPDEALRAEAEKASKLNEGIFSPEWWLEWAGNAGQFSWNTVKSLNKGGWELGVNAAATLRSGLDLLAAESEADDGPFWGASFARQLRSASASLKEAEDWMDKMGGQAPQGDNVVSQFMYDLANQTPQVAVTLLLGLPGLARAGAANAGSLLQAGRGAFGFGSKSSLFMGSQIYGSSYRELKDRKGIGEKEASLGAFINMSGQMPLEMLGATALGRALTGAGKRSFYNFYRRVGSAAAIEGMTEFTQQWPEYVGHLWAESSQHGRDFPERLEWFAREATDTTRLYNALKRGMYEGLLGAAMGGGIGAGGYARNRKRIAAERDEFERLTGLASDMAQMAADAKALEAAFSQADNLGTDTDQTTRYEVISKSLPERNRQMWLTGPDIQSLLQEEEADESLDRLGITRQEAEEAAALGKPLAVDTARVLSFRDEIARKARQKLRPDPDSFSLEEAGGLDQASLFSAMAQSLFQAEDTEADGITDEIGQLGEWQRVYKLASKACERVRSELSQGMNAGEAEAHITHLLAHAMTWYRTYGVMPDQLIRDRYNIEFADEYEPPAPTPDNGQQPADNGQPSPDNGQQPADNGQPSPDNGQQPGASPDEALFSREEEEERDYETLRNKPLRELSDAQLAWLLEQMDNADASAAREAASRQDETDSAERSRPPAASPDEVLFSREEDSPGSGNETGQTGNLTDNDQPAENPTEQTPDDFDDGLTWVDDLISGEDAPAGSGSQTDQTDTSIAADAEYEAWLDSLLADAESFQSAESADFADDRQTFADDSRTSPADNPLSADDSLWPEDDFLPADPDFSSADGELSGPEPGPQSPETSAAPEPGPDSSGNGRRHVVRGQTLLEKGRALIRLFRHRNLSTFLHESGHIYIDDLLRIARDTGATARNNMFRNLARAFRKDGRADIPYIMDLLGLYRKCQEGAASIGDGLSRFHSELSARLRRQTETRREIEKKRKKLNPANPDSLARLAEYDALIAENRLDESRLKRAAAVARLGVRQASAVTQARADILLLARHAGLTREQAAAMLQTPADSPEIAAYTDFQEKSVDQFLAYFMNGDAPTRRLQSAFSRFSFWLKSLYASVRGSGKVRISPEIADVFDRLLATEDQLSRRTGLGASYLFETSFLLNPILAREQRQELQDLLSQARQLASNEQNRNSLARQEKFRSEKTREFLKKLQGEIFWQLCEGESLNTDEARQLLGDEAFKKLAARRPRLFRKDGKSFTDLFNENDLPWQTAEELLNEMYNRLVVDGQTRRRLARKMAQKAADDWMTDHLNDIARHRGQAYAAYLRRCDEILWEHAHGAGGKINEIYRNIMISDADLASLARREIMDTPLGRIKVSAYQKMLAKALQDRAAALAVNNISGALRAMERARLANALIFEALRVSSIHDAVKKRAKALAKIDPRSMPSLYREAIRNLLQATGLGNLNIAADPDYSGMRFAELFNLIFPASQDPGAPLLRPSLGYWLMKLNYTSANGGQAEISPDAMTPAMLQDLSDALACLSKTGYEQGRNSKDTLQKKIEDTAAECAERMNQLPPDNPRSPQTFLGKVKRLIAKAWNNVDALRWEFDRADGLTTLPIPGRDSNAGPMGRYMEEICQAETRDKIRSQQIQSLLAPHITALAESLQKLAKTHGKFLRDKSGRLIPVPAAIARVYGQSGWTADQLAALALNCGNAGNRARIISGYPDMTYDMLAELVGDDLAFEIASPAMRATAVNRNRGGLLTVSDWQHIQGIWDALATQWPDTQKAHEKMFGFKPQQTEVAPVTIRAANGALTLKGGYYPVRYDPGLSQTAGHYTDEDDLLARNDAIVQTPTARRGFTMARQERAPGLPLLFNSGCLMEHVRDVVIFIEKAALVREIDRVTMNDTFKNAYVRAFGQEDYDGIRPNLRGLLRNETINKNSAALVDYAVKLRPYLVAWGLSWNFNVAAIQATAIFPAMGDLGFAPMAESLRYMTVHGLSTLREIHAVSPYMKSRLVNLDMDLQKAMKKLSFKRQAAIRIMGHELTLDDFVDLGLKPVIWVDAMATGAVWMAAYNSKMREIHGNRKHDVYKRKKGQRFDPQDAAHAQAVIYADKTVKASNPDYDPSSRSRFLRDVGVYRLFNGFASAITLFAQRSHHMAIARKKGKLRLSENLRFQFYEYVAGGAAFGLLMGLLQGMGDEPEELARKTGVSILDMFAMKIPMFGPALEYGLLNMLDAHTEASRFSQIRTTVDVPLQILSKGTAAFAGTIKGNEDAGRKLAMSALDLLSFFLRVPISRKVEGAMRGHEQIEADQGTPLNYLIPRPGKPAKGERHMFYGAFD